MIRRLLLLITTVAVLAGACGDDETPVDAGGDPGSTTTTTPAEPPVDPDTPEGRLAAARARWSDAGPASYQLSIRELCFCPETIWVDAVVDGAVVSHEPGSVDSLYDPGARTMAVLFDEVDAVIGAGYATLELEFDPETGALLRYWVDVEEMMADEEHGVEVEVGSVDEPSPVEIDPVTLTEPHGCGNVFALGSAAENLALFLIWTGGEPADLSAVDFPAESWEGELRSGSGLFSNWCTDVLDGTAPETIVDARWTLTDGSLSIEPSGAEVSCGGTTIRARLTGGVATSPEGETLGLGDLEIATDAFGCFPA